MKRSTAFGGALVGLAIGASVLFGLAPAAFAASVPDAPTNVTATPGVLQATVSWVAPTTTGGSPITSYTVTAAPGGSQCIAQTTACVVKGLAPNTAYSFTVVAVNAEGSSPASSASNSVIPTSPPSTTTTTMATTTTKPTTTTSMATTTTTAKSSSSTTWIWVLLVVAGVALIGIIVATVMGSSKKRKADTAWLPSARAALETAALARSLMTSQPTGGDGQLPQVRAQAEDAARSLDRVAQSAPDEQRRQAASSVAEGLRGVIFSLEAEHLLRTNATAPTDQQLAEADLARRRRAGELDAALAQLDAVTRPPER
jgi:Fibronectin type III domain